ncbi:MAG: hypothetical protein D6698_10010 [Gammaproteobacteria bacterium]|nr:MAG: hypothetical protein D6698_10010 [Gammaproteobacteria bacterium]
MPVFAQDPSVLPIKPAFKVGDVFTVLTEKHRSTTRNGITGPAPTIQWESVVEVLELIDRGYVIAWTRGEARLEPPQQLPPSLAVIMDIWNNARFELIVSPEGIIVDIRNYKELSEKLEQTIIHTQNLMASSNTDTAATRQAIEVVKQMLADRSTGVPMLIKDIAGMYGFYGRELELNGQTQYDIELPNPFGGSPIPANETWEFIGWSDDQKTAKFSMTQEIDKERFEDSLELMLKKFTPGEITQKQQMIKAAQSTKIKTTGQLAYESETGRITTVYIRREISAGNSGRTETWKWTLIE